MIIESLNRRYLTSTVIFWIALALAVLGSFATTGELSVPEGTIALMIGLVILVPFFLKGGIRQHPRAATWIAGLIATIFAVGQVMLLMEFVKTKGGEGPRGEGAPGAVILAMDFFALFFLCPWLLTWLRGLKILRGVNEI